MTRPTTLNTAIRKDVNLELDEYNKFIAYIGKDNFSKEIRAMIKNFNMKQKDLTIEEKENVVNNVNPNQNKQIDSLINIENSVVSEQIHQIDNIITLDKIIRNSRLIQQFAKRRKEKIQQTIYTHIYTTQNNNKNKHK